MKKRMTKKFDFKERKQRFSLTLLLAAVVFLVLLMAIVFASLLAYLLFRLGFAGGKTGQLRLGSILLFVSAVSLVIGVILTMLLGKIPLKPINKLVNGMNSLAAGNFKTRIEYAGAIGNHPTFNEIAKSFNTLAGELESTEVLRSDFINNFSHEFKTPIVSIAGFAKLLKKGGLSQEEQAMYLSAIEEESMRLSYMATNVLNLTRIENQSILTDVSTYNLSEQIRSAVLLLENKWTKKSLDLQLDFDEYDIEASEELLKQVWINLVENAVKFAPRCGTVMLKIAEQNGELIVAVSNTGNDIPPDKLGKIFNKFYQTDESHATQGNGIGLAIVKRIVELHSGSITVISENGVTTFVVTLPKNQ